MRAATLATLVCLSAPAIADPAAPGGPGTCEVTISRAPDDVRDAIEKWVRAEPRCSTSLDVRVVPTDGGLYLLARASNGRIYERVVPDAQSAGVLVASWIADDSVTWAPPAREPYPAAPVSPPPSVRRAPPAGPGAVAPSSAPGTRLVAKAEPAREPSWRWIGVSALTSVDFTSDEHVSGHDANTLLQGVRVDLDLLRLGPWKLGIAATTPMKSFFESYDTYSTMEFTDMRGGAGISRTMQTGRWYLRLQAGVGMVYSRMTGEYDDMSTDLAFAPMSASGVFPMVEGGASVGGVFFRNWALDAGALSAWRGQRMRTPDGSVSFDRGVQSSILVGLRRRL